MGEELGPAVLLFVKLCPHVIAIYDLLTKIRIELTDGYFLDLYFNQTRRKYSYTLVHQEERVLGWDNAPHHRELTNFPHHFHREDGTIESSPLRGVPEEDIVLVARAVNDFLAQEQVCQDRGD